MSGRCRSASSAGEIVGLAGLRGAGHEAVGRAIAGVLAAATRHDPRRRTERRIGSPGDAIAAGLGFATGKRAEEALAGNA